MRTTEVRQPMTPKRTKYWQYVFSLIDTQAQAAINLPSRGQITHYPFHLIRRRRVPTSNKAVRGTHFLWYGAIWWILCKITRPNTISPARDLLQQTMLVLTGDENTLLYCLIVWADNAVAITMTTNNDFTVYHLTTDVKFAIASPQLYDNQPTYCVKYTVRMCECYNYIIWRWLNIPFTKACKDNVPFISITISVLKSWQWTLNKAETLQTSCK